EVNPPTIGTLNFWQKATLEDLQAKGLTATMLWERYGNGEEQGHEFNDNHWCALRDLVLNKGLSIDDAFTMIAGLSSAQVGGIKNGLTREDVIHLHNFWQIAALEALKASGLTPKMLL